MLDLPDYSTEEVAEKMINIAMQYNNSINGDNAVQMDNDPNHRA